MRNLSPAEFKHLIQQPGVVTLDVRMPDELEIAALPGTVNIPLPELPARFGELDPAAPIAVLCHHGVRSEHASRFLEHNGFTDVSHLTGGIEAWAVEIDVNVPRY